jgi:flagellar basal body-associated protein FliL
VPVLGIPSPSSTPLEAMSPLRPSTVASRLAPWRWFLFAAVVAIAGCEAPPAFQFDEFDLVPTQDELTELSLGKYAIPIPLSQKNRPASLRSNRVQLEFELHVLIARDQASRINDAWQRHHGNIRDRVIRVCRNASADQLAEPELATLKTHLMDAVQAQLGSKEIRQLLLTDIVSHPL